MSCLSEEYNIEDLYVVKFNKNYKEYLKEKNENITFNPNLYYIVERFKCKYKTITGIIEHYESYKECVSGIEIFDRYSNKEIEDTPLIFDEIYTFSDEYLSEEEKKKKNISSNKLYFVTLDLNIKLARNEIDEEKKLVKKIGN